MHINPKEYLWKTLKFKKIKIFCVVNGDFCHIYTEGRKSRRGNVIFRQIRNGVAVPVVLRKELCETHSSFPY